VYRQTLIHEGDVLVTFLPAAGVPRPVVVAGATVLEAESPVVWFTFPGLWHDIGRFHDPRGRFTGFYANILTPVQVEPDRWRTTDLFLDVFLTPAGDLHVLDEEDLVRAEARGWIDRATAERAVAEVVAITAAAVAGAWPPPVVRDWTLDRAIRAAGTPTPPSVYRSRQS
jgi:uncharacterized protein